MKIREPEYYSKFKCVADRCTDTCCRYWQIELDEDAFKTVNKFKNNSDFADVKIKGKKSDSVILPCKNGNCPFLEGTLLCGLYKKVGHDNLPRTCRLYPRFFNTFGGYEERGLSFSCPTAAELIFKSKPEFNEILNDEPITSFTNVDAERFSAIIDSRNYIIDYVYSSNRALNELVAEIIDYANRVDKALRAERFADAAKERISYEKPTFVYTERVFNKTVALHLHNRILRSSWKDTLKAISYDVNSENTDCFKIWFCYFVYRYLIRSASDLNFTAVIKAAILSYYLISRLGEDQKLSMQRYSKETEHNQENVDRLFRFAEKIKF